MLKNNINVKKYLIFTAICLLYLSFFTVYKYSPNYLNGDVILNSVMSLQNITLYYWGQNRLINLLPLFASFIKNPEYNLLFILYVSALIFYIFLFVLSVLIIKISEVKNISVLELFLFLLSVFIFSFKNIAIFELTIGHIEYSFPALLISILFYTIYFSSIKDKKYLYLLSAVLIFIIIGLNPSNLLTLFFIIFSIYLFSRKITKNIVFIVSCNFISFLIWNKISNFYGYSNYGEFNYLEILESVSKVLNNIYNVVNIEIIFLISLFLLLFIYYRKIDNFNVKKIYMICITILCWIIIWILFFSANYWIKTNEFHWRYFSYVFFSLLMFYGFLFVISFSCVEKKLRSVIIVIISIVSLVHVYSTPIKIYDFKIFKMVEKMEKNSYDFYSGDHFLVWPAVQLNLMKGNAAYGLSYRGIGNQEAVRHIVLEKIKKNGEFKVLCFNDIAEGCLLQVQTIVGKSFLLSQKKLSNNTLEMSVTDRANSLIYNDSNLLSLHGNTGIRNKNFFKTNAKEGCLFFGPFVPMKKGEYMLTVRGNSNNSNSAMVDLVDEAGKVVINKFNIPSNSKIFLLKNEKILIPNNINNLEVRLCVSVNDDLLVTGYELIQME